MNRPGEVAGWPKLVVTYATDPANIAPLLPPGIEPLDPTVTVGFYCVPVLGEPELRREREGRGGVAGRRGSLQPGPRHRPGGGRPHQRRDQRAAQVPLRHRLLPPRRRGHGSGHPPGLHVRRVLGPARSASPSPRRATSPSTSGGSKYSRAIGGEPRRYDFPPHVVDVATTFEQRHIEDVDGELVLRDSPWDPIARYLPIVDAGTAQLVTHQPKARVITNAGPLDPDAFWPFADVIGGSRWPG